MSPQDKCTLSFYRDLEPIADSSKVVLVRHIETGQVFVKKRLSAYCRDIYRYLLNKEFSGIPHVYECLDDDDFIVVIEEYIAGQTLRRYMAEQGTLSEARATEIAGKICLVLEGLHGADRPVICRDLKPENVILSANDSVFLVDFDAAKFVRKEGIDTVLMGTPGYAAPEQFGFAASDERTDVYAIGVLLNEMLTGKLPIEQTAGGHVGRIVEQSTCIDPKERYKTVKELRKDLTGALYAVNGRIDYSRRFLPPGFRSRVWWKMIFAILGYSFAIFIAVMFFIGYETDTKQSEGVLHGIALGLFWLLVFGWTIAYLFDYLGTRTKFGVHKVKLLPVRVIIHFVIWFIGLFTALLLALPIDLLNDALMK
ncbi:MAG: serine/threonine protein kinase [Lachnospiraceae bacterium]|nr:serine/threonine protein kinase [Lachnospiraceae bacterium]